VLLTTIANHGEDTTHGGTIRAETTAVFDSLCGAQTLGLASIRGPATSSNSLVFYGRRLLLKLFRRLEMGTNPDFELGRFLTENRRFSRTPPMAGKIEYHRTNRNEPSTLAILQGLVPNQGDGWGHALEELSRYYERASARMFAPDPIAPDSRPLIQLANSSPPLAALETIAGYLHEATVLGRRTAEMHRALASDRTSIEFSPEPLTERDIDALHEEIRWQGGQAFAALNAHSERLPSAIAHSASELLDHGSEAIERLIAAWRAVPACAKTRIHGDYHLGQVLWVDSDYVILDFEGEPSRTVTDRRAKVSPARDVAGMLRSYHYAAYAGLFSFTEDRPDDFARLEPWADLWQQWVSAVFLAEYVRVTNGEDFMPQDETAFAALLDGFMLGRALYELAYELNNRPDWVRIPLSGVNRLLRLDVAAKQEHAKTVPI
jgi:maltose alpha-D-glucosyltransferase/alpha-amylase